MQGLLSALFFREPVLVPWVELPSNTRESNNLDRIDTATAEKVSSILWTFPIVFVCEWC